MGMMTFAENARPDHKLVRDTEATPGFRTTIFAQHAQSHEDSVASALTGGHLTCLELSTGSNRA